MPTPTLEPDDNGYFYAWWSDNRRTKRKSMGTKDRAVAETRFAEWLLLGGHKGAVTGEGKAGLKVSELWRVYDKLHVQNPEKVAAPDAIRYAWKNLQPHFGQMTLAQVDSDAVEAYRAKRHNGRIGRKAKDSTVRKELSALLACFGWHAHPKRKKDRLLDKGDIPVIELPPEGSPRKRWLRPEQMTALHAAATRLRRGKRTSRLERFLWLALETAARKEAILDLTWDRVDFDLDQIDYNVPGRMVTKKRRVVVPISPALREQMLKWRDERTDDLVLDNKGAVWSMVQLAAIEAGFGGERPKVLRSRKPAATGVSPHILRHTAATYMLLRGVPPWTVAGVLGNSEAMVRKVYGHLCDKAAAEAVAKISGSVGLESDAAILAAVKSGKFKLVEIA